jgi:hypothetical protein
MNVSNVGIATYGNAAIASPPVNDANPKPADPSTAQVVEAAKPANTGQFVDKKV